MRRKIDPFEEPDEIPKYDRMVMDEGSFGRTIIALVFQNIFHFFPQDEGTQVRNSERFLSGCFWAVRLDAAWSSRSFDGSQRVQHF